MATTPDNTFPSRGRPLEHPNIAAIKDNPIKTLFRKSGRPVPASVGQIPGSTPKSVPPTTGHVAGPAVDPAARGSKYA